MPHWRSDLNADLWSQVVLFLDPADHAAVRCVSVELRGSIADHYVNALLLVAEGASRDGTRFPLAGRIPYKGAALIDLPIDPPCGVPSWGAYFALVGGRDALLDEIWRRPLFEGAVVLVDAVEAHEASWRPDGLCAWQRVALAHCIGGRDVLSPVPIDRAGLFSMLCGDGYCPAGSAAAASRAKYCVCRHFNDLQVYLAAAPDGVAVLSFLPAPDIHHVFPRHLAFAFDWKDPNPPTAIPEDFLSGCTTLQSVEFRGMRSVTRIGNSFLFHCNGLTHLSMGDGLGNVAKIGVGFLACCSHLNSIRFGAFPHLETIGRGCLAECTMLTDFSFASQPKLKSIGAAFLWWCTQLSTVNFPEMPNLEEIGDHFLADCPMLTAVNFNGLPKLRTIGSGFCRLSPHLSFVDFSQLEHVTTVGTDAFKGCSETLQPAAQRWMKPRQPSTACRLQ